MCFSTSFQVFSSLKEIWFMLLTGTKTILWEDGKIKFPRGKFAKAPEKSSLGLDFLNSGVCWMMSADLIKTNSPEDIPVWSLCYTFLNATIVRTLLGCKNPLGPLWVEHQSYLSIGKCPEKHHTVVITLYLSEQHPIKLNTMDSLAWQLPGWTEQWITSFMSAFSPHTFSWPPLMAKDLVRFCSDYWRRF